MEEVPNVRGQNHIRHPSGPRIGGRKIVKFFHVDTVRARPTAEGATSGSCDIFETAVVVLTYAGVYLSKLKGRTTN